MNNAMLSIRFLVDNKLKLCKIDDIKIKISDFKTKNDINSSFKVINLDGKELGEDDALELVFAGRTNVDMNSCMIKIIDPSKEN